MLIATTGFVWMLYLIKKSLGETLEEPGKDIPAESGNLASKPAWLRYHVHYYGYALLFLAFDMEMAYMYPWAV
uniref:NADH-quinone oxidoreductase subunit A n=1 Tax=Gracilimonas tropica TaxID=454600 RepID=UPI0003716DA3